MIFGGTKKKATKQATSITIENKGNKVIECGDKAVNLRKELTAAKIDVYPLTAKITGNCGGAGICGTCAVKVCSGMENFNPPSKNEQKTLAEKKKPADYRLSCCSRISGPVTIKVKP
jgi:ferredoxin